MCSYLPTYEVDINHIKCKTNIHNYFIRYTYGIQNFEEWNIDSFKPSGMLHRVYW
jgi:hypothetical protein